MELLMNLLLNSLIYTAENALLAALQNKIIKIISESHFSPDLSTSHHLQSKIFHIFGTWSSSWKTDVRGQYYQIMQYMWKQDLPIGTASQQQVWNRRHSFYVKASMDSNSRFHFKVLIVM